MFPNRGRQRLEPAFLMTALAALVLLSGCRSREPEKKITYTSDPRALQSLDQRAAAPTDPQAQTARPNDPMNDPELARKGQDILRRTGGDINKMNEKEKQTFIEAAKNGHL